MGCIVILAIAGLPDLHPEPWMIARNAKLSKNVWLVFDFPRNVVIVDK